MSRKIKEKPQGGRGAADRIKSAPKELARRSARESAARIREQVRAGREQEQPEEYGYDQIEGGGQRGAALAARSGETFVGATRRIKEKERDAARESHRPAETRTTRPEHGDAMRARVTDRSRGENGYEGSAKATSAEPLSRELRIRTIKNRAEAERIKTRSSADEEQRHPEPSTAWESEMAK